MRIAFALLFLPLLAAGCLDSDDDGSGSGGLLGGNQPRHREPWVVLDRDFATTNAQSSGSFPFALDQDASQLQVTISYERSVFSGFRFTAPSACVAASPGSAFFANSGQSSTMCGELEEGSYDLEWALDAGSVNGHITLVALP